MRIGNAIMGNLATKLHGEDAAFANTLPGVGEEHLNLDEEVSPSSNGFEFELATGIILVGEPNTFTVDRTFIFFCCFFGFRVGGGGRIDGTTKKGKVASTRGGTEAWESERVVMRGKKRKGSRG